MVDPRPIGYPEVIKHYRLERMLGRGAVADPLLARRIRAGTEEHPTEADWNELQGMIAEFWMRVQQKLPPHQSPGRLKQWLGLMRRCYPRAEQLFGSLREARRAPEISAVLERGGLRLNAAAALWPAPDNGRRYPAADTTVSPPPASGEDASPTLSCLI